VPIILEEVLNVLTNFRAVALSRPLVLLSLFNQSALHYLWEVRVNTIRQAPIVVSQGFKDTI
jgi:hypothetical protein